DLVYSGHHQRDHRDEQHGGVRASGSARERLLLAPDAARDDAEAENQKNVSDDRAGERSLNYLNMSGAQSEYGDDQLRRVAEGRVQDSADGRASVRGESFSSLAHHSGERDDSQC